MCTVLYCCHRVATQLQLTNISYHIIPDDSIVIFLNSIITILKRILLHVPVIFSQLEGEGVFLTERNFHFYTGIYHSYLYHHHKHQGLDPLICFVSTVTAARTNASSVFQLFSFLVVCSGMISKGFGFVAFFASVKASSVCINLSCLVCL